MPLSCPVQLYHIAFLLLIVSLGSRRLPDWWSRALVLRPLHTRLQASAALEFGSSFGAKRERDCRTRSRSRSRADRDALPLNGRSNKSRGLFQFQVPMWTVPLPEHPEYLSLRVAPLYHILSAVRRARHVPHQDGSNGAPHIHGEAPVTGGGCAQWSLGRE